MEKQDLRTKEELVSELLIANHNLSITLQKIHEYGWTEELTELYKMFESHYNEVLKEIYRRLDFYEYSKRQ